MNWFSRIYLVCFIVLIGTEVAAAISSFTRLDTMSEHFWLFREHYPRTAFVAASVGLAVLWYHLVLSKGVVK